MLNVLKIKIKKNPFLLIFIIKCVIVGVFWCYNILLRVYGRKVVIIIDK